MVLCDESAHGLHKGGRDEHDEGADLFSDADTRRGDKPQRIDDGQDNEKGEPHQQILKRNRGSEAQDPAENGGVDPDIPARERKGQ